MRCLNFTPTGEQRVLMEAGSYDAALDLAYIHNILFLPGLRAWALADGDETIEAYRCGCISAAECQAHFDAVERDGGAFDANLT